MKDTNKLLSILLVLVALHSIAVGIGLICLPNEIISKFGFLSLTDRFFRTQGGVFHIVMAVAYLIAAKNLTKCPCLVGFVISVKFMATLFLFSYYIFVSPIIMVLLSGIGDLLMAIAILILYLLSNNNSFFTKKGQL